jgi:hypothetical protein
MTVFVSSESRDVTLLLQKRPGYERINPRKWEVVGGCQVGIYNAIVALDDTVIFVCCGRSYSAT